MVTEVRKLLNDGEKPKMAKDEYTQEVKNEFQFWNPEISDSVTGTIVDVFSGEFGDQKILETETGERLVMPNHAVLKNLLQRFDVGSELKIVYDSDVPAKQKGRSPTKMYKVFTKVQ